MDSASGQRSSARTVDEIAADLFERSCLNEGGSGVNDLARNLQRVQVESGVRASECREQVNEKKTEQVNEQANEQANEKKTEQ